ncbi:MAG TPA: hypothetical protein VLO29_05505 [Salegentibacter sp.]|nr:hypothetical protein [Salegentibacter sp.]
MKKFSLIILSLFLFISCATDDDIVDNNQPADPTAVTGVFLDSEVEGLTYTTPTQSGITNSEGEFKYVEGEEILFSVGNIEIGSAEASEVMTPVTIASTTDATVSSQEVMNIAAFLQTLDSDNDPSNGITIEAATVDAISTGSIDFTASIIEILGEITAEVNLATGSNLVPVYPQDAAVHLAETLEEEFVADDWVFMYFIPTIESWTSYPRTSLQWIHETDANGKLVKSYMYEKYPNRVLSEYTYLTFNEFDQPTSYEQEFFYKNGQGSQVSNREVVYSEDHRIEGLQYYNTDGTKGNRIDFVSYNEYNRVTESLHYDKDDNFLVREVYVSSEAGNNLTKIRYSSMSGNDEANILESNSYTYTSFGDLKTRTVNHQTYGLQEYKYSYREDNTLEESTRTSVDLHGRDRTDHHYYDEKELTSRLVITVGDYVSDYVEFYDNGDPKKAETYYKGFLYEIVEWSEDGSSVWTTIDEEDGTYKIEYKDADGTITNTEYFTAEGNMISESTLAGTTWDILYLHTDTITWNADVTFYEDGTAFYTEPAAPGVYDMWGTWSLDGNILTYDMDGENDDPLYYVLTGTISGNNMSGTYTFGERNPEWVAVKKE